MVKKNILQKDILKKVKTIKNKIIILIQFNSMFIINLYFK